MHLIEQKCSVFSLYNLFTFSSTQGFMCFPSAKNVLYSKGLLSTVPDFKW